MKRTPNPKDRLSEQERSAMLRAFDELVSKIPEGNEKDVERELAQVRRARRAGGRQTRPARQ